MTLVIGHWSLVIVLSLLFAAGCAPRQRAEGPAGPGSRSEAGPRSITPGSYGERGGIPVGAYLSLTGDIATFGQSTGKAMIMAAEEINEQGGVLGKKLELLIEDNLSKQDQVAPSVRKLIDKDHVCAVLGEVASSFSLVGAAICQDSKVPMITPSSTNPAVTEGKDHVFRICFIDTFQGGVMARFARDQLHARTSAILSDLKSDYSKGLTQFYREHFEKLGGRIVAEESYAGGDKDFAIQLTKIKRANPDVLYVPGYYTECALIVRQARDYDLNIPVLGGDGWDSPRTVEVAGPAADNTYFSNHYSKDQPDPVVQKFVSNFQKRWNEVPDALAACGYDAVYVLKDALARAGSTDASALRAAIAATRDFHGVTGKITLGPDRNAVKSAVVLEIKKGEQVYVTTIAPDQV